MDDTILPAIVQFLVEFKELAQQKLYVANRIENTQALIDLGLTFTDRLNVLLSLSVEDYSVGPVADRDRSGDLWIFGVTINHVEMYIKLKIVAYEECGTKRHVKQAKCISFHPAIEPLDYPFKKPANFQEE